jgi:hypothetical protein
MERVYKVESPHGRMTEPGHGLAPEHFYLTRLFSSQLQREPDS